MGASRALLARRHTNPRDRHRRRRAPARRLEGLTEIGAGRGRDAGDDPIGVLAELDIAQAHPSRTGGTHAHGIGGERLGLPRGGALRLAVPAHFRRVDLGHAHQHSQFQAEPDARPHLDRVAVDDPNHLRRHGTRQIVRRGCDGCDRRGRKRHEYKAQRGRR